LETERQSSSSELHGHLSSRSRIATRRAPLLWFTCLAKASHAPTRVTGSALPSRGSVIHLAVFGKWVPVPFGTRQPSLGFSSTSEFCPGTLRTSALCAVLSRGLVPPGATHPSRSTTPRLCLPGSRCALTLTMGFDALLPQRAPWYRFNQARPRGHRPSELDLIEIVTFFRCDIPSCD